MANALVGALRVTLGLNSAAFSKGIDKANKKSETFGKRIAKSMKMIAGVSAAAAGAISLAVQGVLQDADKMAKASRKIGVPIDELTELRHAAELSGISFGGLENGLKRLSANMHDASKGIGEGAKAFEELGIVVTNSDGTLKSAKDVMGELAERFEKMPDGAQKTALAMRVMGKSGADMIPLLNGGSQALEDMAAEAVKLGLVFDEQTGRQAEAFNDNITRLQRSFTGLANKLTAQILPSLLALSQRMIDGISNSEGLSNMTDALAVGFNGLIRVINVVIDNFSHLYDLFKLFVGTKIVTYLVSVTYGFVTMAKGIRIAAAAQAVFGAIQKRSLATFVVIAGIIAKVTGYYDDFANTLRVLYDEAKKFVPDELVEGAEDLAGHLKDLVIGTEGLPETLDQIYRGTEIAADSFGELGEKVDSTTTKLKSASEKAKEPVKKLGSELKSAFQDAENMGQSLGDVFSGLANKTLTWKDALKQVISSLGQMALQSFTPTSSAGGFFKGLVGSLFGGFRASGGPVSAGKAYVVGEDGPEIMMPGRSGTVIPNHKLSAANNNSSTFAPSYQIDARGADQAAVARLEQTIDKMNRDAYKRFQAHDKMKNQRNIRA